MLKSVYLSLMPMTHAPETGASFLAPVSGACVIGIRKVKAQRVTVVEFSMYNRSDDGVG